MHNGRDRMLNNIRTQGFDWYCITSDCQNYINNCASCPVKTLRKMPSITTTQIVETAPRKRYQMDYVLLAEDLRQDGLKYLITIEDHFSKFLWATTSVSKEAKNVLLALKTFFALCGIPKIVQCDNGKEFVNTVMDRYLEDNNVRYLHGRPYHPQSQGLIERLNRTVQTALTREFHEKKGNYNLQSSLIDIVTAYNDNMHSTTKLTPKEAFNLDTIKEEDKAKIQWIVANTKKAFKNKITKIKFKENEKVLLFNFVIKGKDEYLRKSLSQKKVTKAYTIPVIIKSVETNYARIQIQQNSKIFNGEVLANEEYNVTFNLIQATNQKRWTTYINDK